MSESEFIYDDFRPPPNPPGRASRYIGRGDREIRLGTPVIPCCRVSKRPQRYRGNLDDQEQGLREFVADFGGVVVGVVRHVGSGWDGPWLIKAVARARMCGAVLLAESTDRFIRPLDYHSKRNPDAQATEEDLRCLRCWTKGVRLLTVLDPDASPREVRSWQRKRGQSAKGRKGGRPRSQPPPEQTPAKYPGYKKDRREAKLPAVLQRRARGESLRQIAEAEEVPVATVEEWIQKHRRGQRGYWLE